jgi:hypothetical protein
MLNFLFKKQEIDKSEVFNDLYSRIKNLYKTDEISSERQKELS